MTQPRSDSLFDGELKHIFYDWGSGNEKAFHVINDIRGGDTYDDTMRRLSDLSDPHYVVYYAGLLLICALVSMTYRKVTGHVKLQREGYRWFGVMAVFAAGFVALYGALHLLHTYFQNPRPFAALPLNAVHVVGDKPPEDETFLSFPSDHAAFITLFIESLWPVLTPILHTLGLLIILTVCWSQIAIGMHFPADVLAGLLLACLMARLVRYICYDVMGLLPKP